MTKTPSPIDIFLAPVEAIDRYPLSNAVRSLIDHTAYGEEPHAMEEGEWRFVIGTRKLTVSGFYAVAARAAVDEARDGELVRLVGRL